MKKRIISILALLMGISITSCGNIDHNSQQIPELLEPVGVEIDTATAQMGELYRVSMYSGEIVPYVEELYFVTGGILDEIKVLNGDMVQEGQVLATLEGEDLQKQIEDLEAEIENIQKNGEFNDRLAEVDIQMEKEELAELYKTGTYAECEAKKVNIQILQTKLAQTKELRSLEVENKNKTLEELRQKSANLEITAPFSGQVVYVKQVQQGETVDGYVSMICLADLTQLSISTDYITEQKIYSADKIQAQIKDQIYEITYVPIDDSEYVAMMLAGETIKTEFSVNAGTEGLESGGFVGVTLYDTYIENTLTIPSNALYRDNQGKYVMKVVDGERIRCDVTVGLTTDAKVEILEGLQEGDVVYVKE